MRSPEKETELNQLDDVLVEQLDVTCRDSISKCLDKTLMNYGEVDVLVNNAGIGKFIVFEEVDETIIRETFETNILGMMWVIQAILPEFRKSRRGTIINVTSTMPHVGLPLATLYCATKMAVEGFSNALYYELKPFGIRVKLVQPGSTRTNAAMQHEPPGEPLNQDYCTSCKNVTQLMKHRYESKMFSKPGEVAEIIYEAAVSKSNRFRFASGRDAKMMNLIKRILPEHTLKSVASRMMGLNN
jgi:short-subunit dehydrogenase